MAEQRKKADTILRNETIGFSLIIALSWATEFFHIPHLIFNEPPTVNWNRAILRTIVVLAIWLWVHVATKRLVKRLHHLEEFLRVCSWCRKVGDGNEWLTMEEYFGSKFDTETSHGICPECARKARNPGSKPPIPMVPETAGPGKGRP